MALLKPIPPDFPDLPERLKKIVPPDEYKKWKKAMEEWRVNHAVSEERYITQVLTSVVNSNTISDGFSNALAAQLANLLLQHNNIANAVISAYASGGYFRSWLDSLICGVNCGKIQYWRVELQCGEGPLTSFFTGRLIDSLQGNQSTIGDVGNGSRFSREVATGRLGGCFVPTLAEVPRIYPGDTLTVYNPTFRFRGVVEQKQFSGGSNSGVWMNIGGTPVNNNFNFFQLKIENPAQTFNLNRHHVSDEGGLLLDFTATIPVRGGSKMTLIANSVDGLSSGNQRGIVVPDISPDPLPFNGQFLQLDEQ